MKARSAWWRAAFEAIRTAQQFSYLTATEKDAAQAGRPQRRMYDRRTKPRMHQQSAGWH